MTTYRSRWSIVGLAIGLVIALAALPPQPLLCLLTVAASTALGCVVGWRIDVLHANERRLREAARPRDRAGLGVIVPQRTWDEYMHGGAV